MIRSRAPLFSLALALTAATLTAQSPTQLTRTTATTGFNDSALTVCSDSLGKTRACSLLETKRALSRGATFDSLRAAGILRAAGLTTLTGGATIGAGKRLTLSANDTIVGRVQFKDTIGGSPVWLSPQTFAAGTFLDSATGAARAQILTTARTIGGTSFNGSANIVPGLADSATGATRAQILTTSRTFWGLSFNGSANVSGKPAFASAWSSTGRDSLLAGSALAFAANDTVYGQPVWNALQHLTADSATGATRSQTLTTARALWGQSFDGSAAITGSLTSVGNITGGASSMTVLAGTGASRTLTLQSSNASSVALNTLVLGADTSITAIGRYLAPSATVSLPAYSFSGATADGIYRPAGDTITFSLNGVRGLSIAGGATASLVGGAGNMTVLGGTGASRTMTLQSTNSASAALNTVVLGADTTTTFLGRSVHANGTAAAPAVNFTNSTGTGLYRFGADTLGIATAGANSLTIQGGAATKLIGGAGNLTILAGTGNSRSVVVQTTNSSGTASNAFTIGAIGGQVTSNLTLQVTPGTASIPAFAFTNSTSSGIYRFGADTVGIAIAGAAGMTFPAVGQMLGIAGNMTLTAGTGNSRTMTLQSTGAAGAAIPTVLLADSAARYLLGRATRPSIALAQSGPDTATGIYSTGGFLNFASRGTRYLDVGSGGVDFYTNLVANIAGTAAAPAYELNTGTMGFYTIGSGADTLGVSTAGVRSLAISGGVTPTIAGGAGNMTIVAGTGASRTMTLQTMNSSSAAVNTLVLGADSSATVLGRLVPNSVKGITGTTTNDNANAGSLGEVITGSRATGSSLSLTTATPLTVDSISLTAGDWDVSGVVAFTPGATTSITYLAGGISTTTNALGALGNNFEWATAANVPTAAHDPVWATPDVRVSLSGTAFVYLVQSSAFSASTLKGYGAMHARRVR